MLYLCIRFRVSRCMVPSSSRNLEISRSRKIMFNPLTPLVMKIGRHTYFWLNTWVFANIIQLATQDFCKRFLNLKNDPCGRQFDQMTQAARSGVANIAEGSSRHSTSRETEMKLTDVKPRQPCRTCQRLYQLAPSARANALVKPFTRIPRYQSHPTRQDYLYRRCIIRKQPPHPRAET